MSEETSAPPSPPKPSPTGLSFATALVPLLTLAVVWNTRLRLAAMPLERDEGEYAYMGQLILDGVSPYREAFGMKFPGIYAAYALLMSLFGQTDIGIRFGLLVMNMATALVLWRLAQERSATRIQEPDEGRPNPLVPVWAGAAFAVLSLAPSLLGVTANAEHFVILPAMAGLLCLYSPSRPWHWLAGGACLGLAVTMKQQGLAFALLGMVWCVYRGRSRDRGIAAESPTDGGDPAVEGPPSVKKQGGGLCLVGFAIPLLAMLVWMAWAGTFWSFWFWTISYASHYGGGSTWRDGIRHFGSQFGPIARDHLLLLAVAVYGLGSTWRTERRRFWLAAGLILAGFAATAPGLIFRSHYFLFVVPGVALAAAWGLSAIQQRFNPTATAIAAALALGSPILAQAGTLLRADPETAVRRLYPSNAFAEMRRVGWWLKDQVPLNDRIAVLGSEPEVFFYSERRSEVPYLYMYPLLENHPFAEEMQRDFMERMERAPPPYVVHVDLPTSWMRNPQSLTDVLVWRRTFLDRRYVRERSVPLPDLPASWALVIYRRKD